MTLLVEIIENSEFLNRHGDFIEILRQNDIGIRKISQKQVEFPNKKIVLKEEPLPPIEEIEISAEVPDYAKVNEEIRKIYLN